MIVKEWHRRGKQETGERRHSFRAWAGKLDWIVQNILQLAPLLEGHEDIHARVQNPALRWLKGVARKLVERGKAGAFLPTIEIVRSIAGAGIEIPGVAGDFSMDDKGSVNAATQGVGRRLSSCFNFRDTIQIDGINAERRTRRDTARGKDIREYRFTCLAAV
jgi:hypothetical protein